MQSYSDNAIKLYNKLYTQEHESIEGCHMRVAEYLADTAEEYNKFKYLLDDQIFRLNTPCMSNAGVKSDPNLCACFILDLVDSMESIIDMWGTCARIYEGGGGAGIPITNLREKGCAISTGGEASGPLSYLQVIQSISDQVKSGGRNRRAANLISYKYDHPDTLDITNCKRDKQSFTAMNLSMLVDDKFMRMACPTKSAHSGEINLDSPSFVHKDEETRFHIVSPKSGPTSKLRSAPDLWDTVIQRAWETGDPGLLFYDRINKHNPLPSFGDIICSNPCGEVVGMPWTECVLGHINLNKYGGDREQRKSIVYWCVLMLNRIIDKTHHPHPYFKKRMRDARPIGMGIMGLADVLFKKKIAYGSPEAQDLTHTITQEINYLAFQSSIELAANGIVDRITLRDADKKHFMEYLRSFGIDPIDEMPGPDCISNSTVTCIAPTGSTSISADCSYGFEPHFALTWNKKLDTGETWTFLDANFKQACQDASIELDDDLIKKIESNKGSINGISEFPDWMQRVFVTAHDVHWRDRIDMQAAAQMNVTMSISSTVNLPHSATKEEVGEIYMYAWSQGLKGITVYRDGCLDNQPVDFGKDKDDKHPAAHPEVFLHKRGFDQKVSAVNVVPGETPEQSSQTNDTQKAKERPSTRTGKTVESKTPGGKLYVTGNYWDGTLQEIFLSMSNQDSKTNHLLNSIGRILSRSLQNGVSIEGLLDTMRGGGGEVFFLKLNDDPAVRVSGVVDAVAHIIDKEFKNNVISEQPEQNPTEECMESAAFERCPECGQYAIRKDAACRGGFCVECGYSNCA